ncbi:ABC transporter permease [Pedobacter caeni]|uniref:ABC-type transport system, involved in lipoprotein release, permease component n=1 Tax=Pedobacter caeni TaxID=288992 RepID=A0A1M5B8P5_9SPHI|nr:ABC transporter permease [Pedobacter caeni]SHF38800.1 ABC-type transport system, involved in lipoprotein release, permease component [Pedobacter caeni]
MFLLNLKIAWRNLWKNKGYTLINISGLSIGIAACLLIFIFINYQLSFDKGYKNADRIYRFVTNWSYTNYDDHSKGIPLPLIPAARNELAGLEKVAGIIKKWGIIYVKDDKGLDFIKANEPVYYTEPDFFEIFDIPWLSGKPQQALSAPNTAALSESTAIRFFGSTEKAIGKSFMLGSQKSLKVTAVFKDMPANSSFPLKIVISYATFNSKKFVNWDGVNSNMECYALLKKGMNIADLTEPLAKFNQKYYPESRTLGRQSNALQPLADIHFDGKYGSFADAGISKTEIYGLGIIGLFLILTACINFINLATAQSVNRSKEVGVRKVIGGKRKELVVQFLTETFVITAVAMLIACILTEIAVPGMRSLFKDPTPLSLFGEPVIFLFMGGMILLVSFLAGFYPAMIMSGFSPVLAIKNKVTVNASGLSLRKILVVLQFTITIVLIVGTLVIMSQMKYLREKPLGFNKDAIAMVEMPTDSLSQAKYNTFRERLMQIPGIEMISFCQTPPSSDNITSTDFSYNGQKNVDFELRNAKADENYFKLFDLKLIAGKAFIKSDTTNGCVVNETFLKKMNISNPQEVIGKMLKANGFLMPVTGVVKDYNDLSLKESISPLVIYPQKGEYYQLAVKLDSKQLKSAMTKIAGLWNSTYPNYIYNANFLNDNINSYYQTEQLTGTLFKIASGVIIFISFIGLFGLISFIAAQRTREVAIRKVLGASTLELVKMLNGSFLIMVFLANLLAWPIAYLLVSHWLSAYAYRVDLSVWPFVFAFLISMTITLITVSVKSYRTAIANTIDALKYE